MSMIEVNFGRLLDDRMSRAMGDGSEGEWSRELWDQVDSAGFTRVGVPDNLNGTGGEFDDGVEVIRTAAKRAAPLPLAEAAIIAAPLLTAANVEFDGPYAVALTRAQGMELGSRPTGPTLTGKIPNVPWASVARNIIVAIDQPIDSAFLVPATGVHLAPHSTLAGEPSATIALETSPALPLSVAPGTFRQVACTGALARSIQIAAACERILDMTLRYANERSQFGRPIARFQAIQHHLADIAGETFAADMATAAAQPPAATVAWWRAAAAAKIRCGLAGSKVARLAHQVHGAIGFTREYQLHLLTRRIWCWRDDFGSEWVWMDWLGEQVAGPDLRFWRSMTETTG